MSSQDLRQQAQRLRQQLPERRGGSPPPETGRRLATIPRPKDDEEIRINWCEYEGHPYLSVRFWRKGADGQFWPDKNKGMSIRLRELPDVADAISEALTLAEAHQRSRPRQGQRPGGDIVSPPADRSHRPGPRPHGEPHRPADDVPTKSSINAAFRPSLPPASAELFDEFTDG